MKKKFVIHGAGNLGTSIANGINKSKLTDGKIILTREHSFFSDKEKKLFECDLDSIEATKNADIVFIAVQPKQLDGLITRIAPHLHKKKDQVIISTVSGASIQKLKKLLGKFGKGMAIVRAMPNTSIKIGNSMTCIAFSEEAEKYADEVKMIFDSLGKTLIIKEEMFPQATVLCGSGTAIMARCIRVYMQAGIQNGFNEKDSFLIATQVMKGVSILLQTEELHPEVAIDKVTTPGGCTITTLAYMEHGGFSSSLLKAVELGIEKARSL